MSRVSLSTLLWRAVRRRCPRCGGKGIFSSWLKLRERCPTCGYRFEREEGFFTGVYLVNYSLIAVAIVIELFFYVIYANAQDGDASLVPALVVGFATAIILPVITYPFAKATWAAIDLAARPLEPVEEADAALHAEPESVDPA
ncbi:MAG: hypothetical protein QOH79_3324 [Acidimicrobiaceae bacterium]|jgi:uncharacterized protein (DUF983 family)